MTLQKTAKRIDWKTEPLPAEHIVLEIGAFYTAADMKVIKKGLIPEEMEDKWFIFFEQNALYFHRSWTGYCVFQAHFKRIGQKYSLTHAEVNRDKGQYTEEDDSQDRRLVSYLIDLLLLHKEVDYPTSSDEAEVNPLKVWSLVGQAMLGMGPTSGTAKSIFNLSTPGSNIVELVRIIPAQRFVGIPAPKQRPYAFYADLNSLRGRTLSECYRFVKGLDLPPKDFCFKERRTPFSWWPENEDQDAPLLRHVVSRDGELASSTRSKQELDEIEFVVLGISAYDAYADLDAFPATWRALAYIISDAERMGARSLEWKLTPEQFASARVHAIFSSIKTEAGEELLAKQTTKSALGLEDLWQLPNPDDELKYYSYLSTDSMFTDDIVELFGLQHRCWHGCGYLGWAGEPVCRYFLLRNRMHPRMKIAVMRGRDSFPPESFELQAERPTA